MARELKTKTHGEPACYTHSKCRCDLCRRAFMDYQLAWRHRNENALADHRARSLRWWKAHPYVSTPKTRARARVNSAIKSGVITRQPCEVCGESPVRSDGRSLVEAHHDDYSRPLDVRWLCRTHHVELERAA